MKKKIEKYLNKKIEIYNVIGLTLGGILVILLAEIFFLKLIWDKDYIYEDLVGNNGYSNKCIHKKDGLYCNQLIQVEWFSKR